MEEKKNDQLQAVCLAAGALAVMAASLDRAAVVYLIVKQWRSWVFVVLNILLLAIVFTSKHGAFCNSKAESDVDNYIEELEVDSKTERKKSVRKEEEEQQWQNEITKDEDHRCKVLKSVEKKDEDEEKEKIIECDDSGKSRLSNEELNERVEAFIATFRRQYLVSDIKGKRSSSACTSPAKNGGDILLKSISV